MAEWELRDYGIEEGHFEEFLAAWMAGVLPLRRAFGFEVEAWAVPADRRFVWLLRYDGPDTFAAADEAYYASPARAALDPDPAQWIVEQRVSMVSPIDLSGHQVRSGG